MNVEAEVMGVSDHAPVVVTIVNNARRGGKPFRFFYF